QYHRRLTYKHASARPTCTNTRAYPTLPSAVTDGNGTVTVTGGETPRSQAPARQVLWLLISILVVSFYFWTATSSSTPEDWVWGPKAGQAAAQPGPENYYNLLVS